MADARETGAARAFTMRMRQTRLEALQRSVNVALHFVTTSDAPHFRAYVDGNGNGVRTREIASGADPPLGPVVGIGRRPWRRAVRACAGRPCVSDEDDGLGGVR